MNTVERGLLFPIGLSIIAGVTDVTSWLLLGGFFSAHVTGNLVLMAADVVTGTKPAVLAVLALPIFVVTTVIATLCVHAIGPNSARASTAMLGAQAVLLGAAGALSFTPQATVSPTDDMAVLIGICAVCAMATQNAYLHLVAPRAISTTTMTGNLVAATVAATNIVRTRGKDPDSRAKWAGSWPLIAGFVAGCLVGAAGVSLYSGHAVIIPGTLAGLLFVGEVLRRKRADTGQTDTPEQGVRRKAWTAP